MMTQASTTANVEQSLNEQTQEAKQAFIASLPADQQQIVGDCMQRLLSSQVAENAKKEGDTAPDFTLVNAAGGRTRLADLLDNGPVILNFYRGGWCPFCNLEFRALQQYLPQMQALGATLVGVSPETPDNSLSTQQKHQLTFDVLSDVGNRVAREYGLVMQVYEDMRPLYVQWGIDVPAANGDETYELPVPATYVIDTTATIRAAFVDKDYTKRMEPEAIVATLQRL